MRRLLAILLLLAALLATACGDDDTDGGKDKTGKAAAGEATPAPAPGCRGVARPRPKDEQTLPKPGEKLSANRTYDVTLATNCGAIVIRLDVRRAPKTAASFASLVKRGFYDGLAFHRIGRGPDGSDFVIQGGDPLGTGQGGPGYTVVEKPPAKLRYTRGVVAMAKTELEAAGTSGSQFSIVTAEDAGLPPDYALVGRVARGDAAVARIASVPTDAGEVPRRPVVIRTAKLTVK